MKGHIRKTLLAAGILAAVLTGLGTRQMAAKADVLEETTETSTETGDEFSHGNITELEKGQKLRDELKTDKETSMYSEGFSYYWYNNARPNQKTTGKNGKTYYYQTRYEYLDIPENENDRKKFEKNLNKKNINKYSHYEKSIFQVYQKNPNIIYEDAYGNVVIQTESTDRNSDNFYRTIGYTFSRIKSSGVMNLKSKKVSKRKEVPADKKSLRDENYNVDDATEEDWRKLYGSDPHYGKKGERETIEIWLPTQVYEKEKRETPNGRLSLGIGCHFEIY